MLSSRARYTGLITLGAGAALAWAILGPWSTPAPGVVPPEGSARAQATTSNPEPIARSSAEEVTKDRDAALQRTAFVLSAEDVESAEEQHARGVIKKARQDGRAVILAEVLWLKEIPEARYPVLGWTDPAYHRVKLCAFLRTEADGPIQYHLMNLQTNVTWSQDRMQLAPRAECLKVGQVREFVVEGIWLNKSALKKDEHAAILFVGPEVEAPYGDEVAAMPRRLFGPLSRGAAIFTGEIVARSWRPSDRLHQLAKLGETIDVLEVVVDEVLRGKGAVAPRARLRLDVPQGPRLSRGGPLVSREAARRIDYDSMVVGGRFWFAADSISGKLSLLDAVGR